MSFNNSVSDKLRKPKKETTEGPSEKLLMPKTKDRIMSKPVVIPSSINMNSTKKLSKIKPQPEKEENYQKLELNNGNIKEQKKIRKKFLTKRAGPDIINKLPRERDAQDLEN